MTKKRLIYIVLGTLLSVSCSQEEMIRDKSDADSNRITFRASLPEVSTRATEINNKNLDNFQVTCFIEGEGAVTPYFIDKKFEKNIDRFTSSDPECVWPDNNTQLKFIAFTPSCDTMRELDNFVTTDFALATVSGTLNYKLENFRVAQDIANQIDFVTATTTGNLLDNDETDIDLVFQHQLSRIEVEAWGANKSYDIEIAGVRIGGVAVKGDFNFIPNAGAEGAEVAGYWENPSKGVVEYVFRKGDNLITLDKAANSPSSVSQAVSIMGNKIGGDQGYANSAMLIPGKTEKWDYKNNPGNASNTENSDPKGSYLSVLLRVIDATEYKSGSQVYPYNNDEDMEVIYLAVDSSTKKEVKDRLYKQGDKYFTDSSFKTEYNLYEAEVKEFGWAALPINCDWQPGCIYTYTLNYSNGVGLREPTDPTHPGESIISDKVIVNVEMSPWQRKPENSYDETVPRK